MPNLPGGKKPTIVVADTDPASLPVIVEEVRTRSGRDCQMLPFSSAPEAVAQVHALTDGGHEVALILADQWLPGMSGWNYSLRSRSTRWSVPPAEPYSSSGATDPRPGPLCAPALGHRPAAHRRGSRRSRLPPQRWRLPTRIGGWPANRPPLRQPPSFDRGEARA